MNVAEWHEKIHLEIVTPERVVVSEDVDSVNAPGALGEFGVLPGHTPMLTTLTIGRVSYRAGGRTTDLAIAWGYAEVGPEKVTILAETAEKVEEIDVARAESARQRALEQLSKRGEGVDPDRAMEAFKRATLRLQVGGGKEAPRH
jgi:F-type H+-transporting ATPase subunit epsilon